MKKLTEEEFAQMTGKVELTDLESIALRVKFGLTVTPREQDIHDLMTGSGLYSFTGAAEHIGDSFRDARKRGLSLLRKFRKKSV